MRRIITIETHKAFISSFQLGESDQEEANIEKGRQYDPIVSKAQERCQTLQSVPRVYCQANHHATPESLTTPTIKLRPASNVPLHSQGYFPVTYRPYEALIPLRWLLQAIILVRRLVLVIRLV